MVLQNLVLEFSSKFTFNQQIIEQVTKDSTVYCLLSWFKQGLKYQLNSLRRHSLCLSRNLPPPRTSAEAKVTFLAVCLLAFPITAADFEPREVQRTPELCEH